MLTKSTIAPTTFTKFKEASMHIVQPAITFVNAIRVVIGMHALPPSHCTDKVACDAAKPTVRRRTFKTYKAKLYGAE